MILAWPYSFMNVCKLLDLCPEMVRTGTSWPMRRWVPFQYWIRRAGRLSRKLGTSVVRAFEGRRSQEAVESNQFAASV